MDDPYNRVAGRFRSYAAQLLLYLAVAASGCPVRSLIGTTSIGVKVVQELAGFGTCYRYFSHGAGTFRCCEATRALQQSKYLTTQHIYWWFSHPHPVVLQQLDCGGADLVAEFEPVLAMQAFQASARYRTAFLYIMLTFCDSLSRQQGTLAVSPLLLMVVGLLVCCFPQAPKPCAEAPASRDQSCRRLYQPLTKPHLRPSCLLWPQQTSRLSAARSSWFALSLLQQQL